MENCICAEFKPLTNGALAEAEGVDESRGRIKAYIRPYISVFSLFKKRVSRFMGCGTNKLAGHGAKSDAPKRGIRAKPRNVTTRDKRDG